MLIDKFQCFKNFYGLYFWAKTKATDIYLDLPNVKNGAFTVILPYRLLVVEVASKNQRPVVPKRLWFLRSEAVAAIEGGTVL